MDGSAPDTPPFWVALRYRVWRDEIHLLAASDALLAAGLAEPAQIRELASSASACQRDFIHILDEPLPAGVLPEFFQTREKDIPESLRTLVSELLAAPLLGLPDDVLDLFKLAPEEETCTLYGTGSFFPDPGLALEAASSKSVDSAPKALLEALLTSPWARAASIRACSGDLPPSAPFMGIDEVDDQNGVTDEAYAKRELLLLELASAPGARRRPIGL